jgi:septal ring factor EnvC (AmiA/AmiB activator)
MFYILVFSGLAFFVFGVVSTLYNSLKIQREYELITTELVRTDSSLRDLEAKYTESQNELKMFKVNIEASNGWTKEGLNGTHGELEKMKAEYVRVKLRPEKDGFLSVAGVQEKCNELIRESEEYNKLLTERNNELSKLKGVFDDIKRQLEANQAALAATQQELKGLQTNSDAQEKLKNVVEELESLKERGPVVEDPARNDDRAIDDAAVSEAEDIGASDAQADTGDAETQNNSDRKHLETMRSFLDSLDDKSVDDYKLENNDTRDGE